MMSLQKMVAIVLGTACSTLAQAQPPESPVQRLAAQRDAMARLAILDGIWRGKGSIVLPDGKKHEIVQTERVGPFLDGTVKMVEGRGHEPDGKVSFNALGIISYDPDKQVYSMHSYAQGHAGDFVVTPLADGFAWDIPAGPMTIKYVAIVKDGVWHETGDRVLPGKEPVRFFDMTLKRLGDSSWPAAGAVGVN